MTTKRVTVPFDRKTRLQRHRKQRLARLKPGNETSGHTMAKRGATSTSARPAIWAHNADGRMCVKPAREVTPWQIAQNLPNPRSPFDVAKWRQALDNLPDQPLVKSLLHEIQHGVALGYQGPTLPHCHPNHQSTIEFSLPVVQELNRELGLLRKVGPFTSPPSPRFVGSPLGAIPKKHSNPQRYRIIHDLSWPGPINQRSHLLRTFTLQLRHTRPSHQPHQTRGPCSIDGET